MFQDSELAFKVVFLGLPEEFHGIPVVVSHHPELSEWIDALESVAVDYCTPPFDFTHIHRLLDAAHRQHYSC